MVIRTHNGGWAIFAEYALFGVVAERVVFGGARTSIWECIKVRREREYVAKVARENN